MTGICLESNNIYNGNCLDLMEKIPNNSVDMILCDLPYGMTAGKWDSVISFDSLWPIYNRIVKDGSAICLFGSQPFTSIMVNSNIKNFKHHWIWEKEHRVGFQIAKYRPLMVTEDIIIFSKNGSKLNYNPIMIERETIRRSTGASTYSSTSPLQNINKQNYIYTHKFPINLLKFSRDRNKYHPTQKPVKLLKYLISTYTNVNEIVLDNCMGSGSTCVAAKSLGRKYIGIELEYKYFSIAKKRLKNTNIPLSVRKENKKKSTPIELTRLSRKEV